MILFDDGKLAEARRLQAIVAWGDWVAIQGGFVGVKAAVGRYFGLRVGGSRRPCVQPGEEELRTMVDGFAELMEVERGL
jgi:4-hydroxy-2-oxoglutarate aldolase